MRRLAIALVAVLAGCTGSGTPASTTPTAVPTQTPAPTTSSPAPPPTSSAPAPSTPPTPRTTHPAAATTPAPPTTPEAPAVPPVSDAAREAGLVDVRTVVPDAILDLRYAASHNFVGVRLYPSDARCLVHGSMAPGLRVAASRLRAEGYRLVFWDCYRPHAVQIRMFQVVADPDWVARPGPYARSHEAARSVDVTLARAGEEIDMGTGFDDFTVRAHAFAAGITAAQRTDRARLRHAMEAGGLAVYSGEWWHFDGPGAFVHRPVLDVPVD